MATPGQLVSKLSEVLNIAEATMAVYDRALRDAGLLSKGGRGRSSVHRTPLDTARLLIALLVTSSPARAPEAVNDFGCLEIEQVILRNPDYLTLSKLCGPKFDDGHTLEEALSAIIEGFGQDGFMDMLEENANKSKIGDDMIFLPHIGIKIWDTKVAAEINIAGNFHIYQHPTALAFSQFYKEGKGVGGNNNSELEELSRAHFNMLSKYSGIRTERSLMMPEILPIAEFVCGVQRST